MEFGVRRHHLLEEAKLDIAYEEVKRAEQESMAYEAEYTEKSKALNGAADTLRALMAEKEAHQENLESLNCMICNGLPFSGLPKSARYSR